MKLVFLGDSTMQYNDETTYPQVGWPQGLTPYLNKEVEVFNYAENGRSTKTFMNTGRFDKALKVIDENSVVLIEFGHNDGHTYDPERYTTPQEYKNNLKKMIDSCKEKGARVILLTPIYRRNFNENGLLEENCHFGYYQKALELAKEDKLDLVDMTLLTKQMLIQEGPEASKRFFMQFKENVYPNYPLGKQDNTHLVIEGAKMISKLFVQEVFRQNLLEGIFHEL